MKLFRVVVEQVNIQTYLVEAHCPKCAKEQVKKERTPDKIGKKVSLYRRELPIHNWWCVEQEHELEGEYNDYE